MSPIWNLVFALSTSRAVPVEMSESVPSPICSRPMYGVSPSEVGDTVSLTSLAQSPKRTWGQRSEVDPFLSTIQSFSITVRKFSETLAQSEMSTRTGKSDLVNAVRNDARRSMLKGSAVINARSRSEVSRAVQDTREPKARTSISGTCSCKIFRTVSNSAGAMSIGFTVSYPKLVEQVVHVAQEAVHLCDGLFRQLHVVGV